MILKPFQEEALKALKSPSVHLALTAPTGSGKGTLVEALLNDARERILLITPLIALQRQQYQRLSPSNPKLDRIWIVNPESLSLDRIRRFDPTLVVVDEAHCVEEWGESFRPAYPIVLDLLINVKARRTLWMSATFPKVLVERLQHVLPGVWSTQGSFKLSASISLELINVRPLERLEILRQALIEKRHPGILFVNTRNNVEKYRRVFPTNHSTLPYHAGLSDEERRSVEKQLAQPEGTTIPLSVVATSAFGMGMDYPQFEWVTLGQTPYSILSLLQAVGRIGRNGKAGRAVLYWCEEDFRFCGMLAKTEKQQKGLARLRTFLESSSNERTRMLREDFL